jgi:hypothetical protein
MFENYLSIIVFMGEMNELHGDHGIFHIWFYL